MKTNPIRAHAAIALPLSGIRSLALFLVLAIAGCATVSHTTTEPSPQPLPPEETGQYETVTGREPALVADLRAAPPPAEPEIADGRNIGAEETEKPRAKSVGAGEAETEERRLDERPETLADDFGARVGRDAALGEVRGRGSVGGHDLG